MYRLSCEQGLQLYRYVAVETITHNDKQVYTVLASGEDLDDLKRTTRNCEYLMWREYMALPKI